MAGPDSQYLNDSSKNGARQRAEARKARAGKLSTPFHLVGIVDMHLAWNHHTKTKQIGGPKDGTRSKYRFDGD